MEHRRRVVDPDHRANYTRLTARVEVNAWQLALLCVGVAVLNAWVGYRKDPIVSSSITAASIGVNFGLSARRIQTDDILLWPVSAAAILMGAFVGALAVSATVDLWRTRRTSSQH